MRVQQVLRNLSGCKRIRDIAQRDQRCTGWEQLPLKRLRRVAEELLPARKFKVWAKPDESEVLTADHRGQGRPRHSRLLKQSS